MCTSHGLSNSIIPLVPPPPLLLFSLHALQSATRSCRRTPTATLFHLRQPVAVTPAHGAQKAAILSEVLFSPKRKKVVQMQVFPVPVKFWRRPRAPLPPRHQGAAACDWLPLPQRGPEPAGPPVCPHELLSAAGSHLSPRVAHVDVLLNSAAHQTQKLYFC